MGRTIDRERESGAQPRPCCVPSKERAHLADLSVQLAGARRRVSRGSTTDMVRLDGGAFFMGTESKEAFRADGEGPVRKVVVDSFFIDRHMVTNERFEEFVRATGYKTEAERFAWSFVFAGHLDPAERARLVEDTVMGAEWWCKVRGADWKHPEGPDSQIENRLHHPVVHISWNDASAFAEWAGKRLPTEAEWEMAARGGLEQKLYPWGDELTPGGEHLCNIWQGEFPVCDTAEDGFSAPAPVNTYPPNGYGLYTITGNAWEWCSDWFDAAYHQLATRTNPVGPPHGQAKVIKGGSYLCHSSYCNRYRVAARSSNTPESATTNMSFRCVRDL